MRVFQSTTEEASTTLELTAAKSSAKMTTQRKYSRALLEVKKLANTISMFTDVEFHRKMEQVKQLNEHWSQKKEVGFQIFENLLSSSSARSNDNDNAPADRYSTTNDGVLPDYIDPDDSMSNAFIESDMSERHHSITLDSLDDQMVETLVSLEDGIRENDSLTQKESAIEFEPLNLSVPNELTVTKLNITMPPALVRRGRPKNSEKTNVIGLPKQKKGKVSTLSRFVDMKNSEKEKQVLGWCVGEDVSKSYLGSGEKIRADIIDPTEISAALYNDFVNIESISYWFDSDAWIKFKIFFDAKAASFVNRCSSCSKVDECHDELISCDHCLLNFHYTCAKLKKISKKRSHWFCNRCKVDLKSNEQDQDTNIEG